MHCPILQMSLIINAQKLCSLCTRTKGLRFNVFCVQRDEGTHKESISRLMSEAKRRLCDNQKFRIHAQKLSSTASMATHIRCTQHLPGSGLRDVDTPKTKLLLMTWDGVYHEHNPAYLM